MDTLSFIKQNEGYAISDAVKTGVPASITMGQAIIESGHGNSRLYQIANNTFGIKCHSDWKGPSVRANDDAPNECFRKYDSVKESFRDHSKFLKENSRYKKLFELDPSDYKSWARGLKQAGYATAPNYDTALISIIEQFKLQDLDRKVKTRRTLRKILIPLVLVLLLIVAIIMYYKFRQRATLKPILA